MSFNARSSVVVVLVAASLGAVAGCQQTVVSDRPGRVVRTDAGAPGQGPPGAPDVAITGNALDAFDPGASRLHDISGLLLRYWQLNKGLPNTLQELKTIDTFGLNPDLTSPYDGRPFAYMPENTPTVGLNHRLVVYTPTPAPDGKHKAILMRLPKGSQVPAAWVVGLTPIELQGYLGSAPATMPTQ